jgi:DNA-binding NarL/FixJ family response regulator
VVKNCNIKVLIADDHWLIRRSLSTFLEQTDCIQLVGQAENGQIAVELVEKLRPHVVLMDVRMPVLGGAAATKIIKDRYPQTRVIVLSNSSDEFDKQVMIDAGASEYLTKSVNPNTLEQTIRDVFSRGQSGNA